MKVLLNLLKEYIPFSIPAHELADRLSMLGVEIESVTNLGDRYKGFVVGKVLVVNAHPNGDKLRVCSVDIGKETLQIVCGAPNVAAGQKVAVGLVGATIPHNQHDPDGKPFVLSNVKIRGVESFGMICSEFELDLGKDSDGILVLDEKAPVGKPLARWLGLDEVILDVEITPNRPDWLSHIGVAREIGVLVGRTPKLPAVAIKEGAIPISKVLRVTVKDSKNCLRFAARMIRGVKVGPSPRWLQDVLRNAGLRPRNNIVDITNYVMLECGHPLHAFDYARLRGGEIIVRQAVPGTPFTTLDGKRHTLPDEAVMVCDAEREVSIAGVMGGENSEIMDSTVDVVIESAYWNPSSIRRTAKRLGITSDASQRFERGADPNAVTYALDRATSLVLEYAGGSLLKGSIDRYPMKIREKTVALRPVRVNTILGTTMSTAQIVRALRLLNINRVGTSGDSIRFKVPTYRVDIDREIDLIEEVARVYGYNKIEEKTSAAVDIAHPFPRQDQEANLRDRLIGLGFQEVISNSMQTEKLALVSGVMPVAIMNPQNREMTHLRTSLVPGLLEVVARNVSMGNANLRLFELGHVFCIDESDVPKIVENFLEESKVCLLWSGLASPRHWGGAVRPVDVFDAKGCLEDLLGGAALDKGWVISYSTSNGLTDITLRIDIHGSYAGYLGQIKKELLKLTGLEQEVFAAELDVSSLVERKRATFAQLPKYPKVKRDVAFVVEESVAAEVLEREIRAVGSKLLQQVELFDLYRGEPLKAGTKSLAFTLELMSAEKTLTDREIDTEVRQIVERLEKSVGATLRSLS